MMADARTSRRQSSKQRKSFETSKSTPSNTLPSQPATHWGPCVQMPETSKGYLSQTTTTTNNILISYFVAFPNFIRKDTRPRIDDMISKEEEEGRGGGRRKRKRSCSNTDLPNFNMYYKVMKVKTVWYWWKNRQDKWKRIENLGMNPQKLII